MAKLFVIGHGRSGTTVLMNALNTSSDVYMLGEANFVLFANEPGFRDRFNAQHRSFGNQRTKSTYAPALSNLPASATALEYFARLESEYAWAGEKIALSYQHDLKSIRNAFEREWWDAEIIWSLRRPRFALASMKRVFSYDDLRRDINVMCRALLWLVDLARTRRRVFVLPFELVHTSGLEIIGDTLSFDLTQGEELYTALSIDDHEFGRNGPFANEMSRLDVAYDALIEAIDTERCVFRQSILQAEQKLPGFEPPGGFDRASKFGAMVVELMMIEKETRNLSPEN